jgi:hypothetical protein
MKERGDTFLSVDTLWLECLNDNKARRLPSLPFAGYITC